jgi:hypothetical protein
MILNKKNIRSTNFFDNILQNGERFVLGVKSEARFAEILKRVGFSEKLEQGDRVLPSSVFGATSLYNAEGKEIKHKDMPMETVYSQRVWHWQEWHGRYERVDREKIVNVPHQRYPRSFIEPPSIEMTVSKNASGTTIITSPVIIFDEKNAKDIIHIANLFLEIFGECEIFKENLDEIIKTPVQRLNWRILPAGQIPWPKFKTEVEPLIKEAPAGNRPVLKYRLENIDKYNPDFVAIGYGGFRGYIVFGFKKKNIYALESLYYGNATYMLGETWEELSKKTKAEILNQNLQKDRLIHTDNWQNKLGNWLKS